MSEPSFTRMGALVGSLEGTLNQLSDENARLRDDISRARAALSKREP